MKTFVFGVVIGSLLSFGVIRIFGATRITDPQIARGDAPEPSIADATTPSYCPDTRVASSAASAATMDGGNGARPIVQSPAFDNARAVVTPSVSPESGKEWIERLTEKEAFELCTRASQLRQAREQAAKEAEPKDASWAYSMEQLIRQHVEMHLPADKYTKLQVECRTTFCELRMEGTSADGQELANKVVQQIQHQEWSDVAQKGSGGGSYGETWHIEYEWFRPRTEGERRAWFWNRHGQRERR